MRNAFIELSSTIQFLKLFLSGTLKVDIGYLLQQAIDVLLEIDKSSRQFTNWYLSIAWCRYSRPKEVNENRRKYWNIYKRLHSGRATKNNKQMANISRCMAVYQAIETKRYRANERQRKNVISRAWSRRDSRNEPNE